MQGNRKEDESLPGNGEDRSESPESLLLNHANRLGRGSGSSESFRYVYEACYGQVRHFFSRRGYGPETARDLTQDAFLRVLQGRGEFESVRELRGWLFRISLNVHRNAVRASHTIKRRAFETSLDEWIDERGSAPPAPYDGRRVDPLEETLDRELTMVLARSFEKLPPKMRRCFLFHVYQGWTYREVAERLGIAEGTVKAHIHQARRKLDELLAPYLDRERSRGSGGDEE